ncbi:DUF952 domain-containing protein [Komagataeibacter oboediens]|uniref:DUF952 domain-containing protein n=1 Tax=Komagataeibacter oboediens TaxID=65958 RepID=UPI001C2C38B3|nr:DUF952 domain-containing protein [Komagataeibacter oboediens]MBV0890098.1 DUF952 domain-containing protein [Komagataeibacter oboediens]MCK9821321.1 DUF952 domain-containing protein [Komagataeibacter oboediens]
MTDRIVYKIMTPDEYDSFTHTGSLAGSPVDLADGFIHLSAGPQVADTLDRHFSGRSGLVLVAVDLSLLDPAVVRWEPSRGGQLFPHLYAPLPIGAVVATGPVTRTADGGVDLPA